jgi:endonuclease/exonuclease/phosphatase (EEP) superfamily protein YafD
MLTKVNQYLRAQIGSIDYRRIAILLTTIIFVPVFICSLLAYLATFDRLLELMTHFRFQYLIGGILAVIIYSFKKHRIGIFLALFCVGLNAIEIVPWYLPIDRSPNRNLRVMVSNVLTSNQRYGDFIDYVRSTNPEILVVMEVDLKWQQQLESLKASLPYTFVRPSSDNFGIAIFSKFPLVKPQEQSWGDGIAVVSSLTANIEVVDRVITLIATHPVPPLNAEYFKSRNSHMEAMSKFINKLGNEAIVMGDLNMSMWSPYYRNFVDLSQLKNTRQGFGIQPSWPVNLPLLRIPLDHCLVTSKIKVVNNQIGKDIGSDHYPLIADLAIAKN